MRLVKWAHGHYRLVTGDCSALGGSCKSLMNIDAGVPFVQMAPRSIRCCRLCMLALPPTRWNGMTFYIMMDRHLSTGLALFGWLDT